MPALARVVTAAGTHPIVRCSRVEGVVLRTGREARRTAPRVLWLVDYLERVATTTMRGESSLSSEPEMSE